MSLNYVTLTLDLYDGQGNYPVSGTASFTPSAVLTDAGVEIVGQQPIVAVFHAAGPPTVKLLATDNAGPLPSGWTWSVSFSGITGAPAAFSFFLPGAGGASQLLSSLAPVSTGSTSMPFLLNPMTQLGDTLYENATPAAARLPGNTSATKNFYTQTGTGSASAAPAWGTIAAGDLPAATDATQGAVILDGTAADIQPLGVQSDGETGKAADAGHVHPYQPWQFLPETYGALGNGKVIGDAVLSSNTTLTSASAGFTSADTGKYIMVNGGAGTANIPLITTITFVNSTTVTLGSAASVSGSAFQAVYGTDDTAAINSAVSAAKTYALANEYFAEVVFGAKIYVLATGPTQSGNGSSTPTFNAQIPLPYPNANGTTQKLVIALTGAGDAGAIQFWLSTTPDLAGTALVSMTTAPLTPSATFGRQSVIGGPSGAAGFTGSFANVKAAVKGITVWCPIFTNQIAFDFGYLGGARADSCSAQVFAPPNAGNHPYLSDLPPSSVFQNNTTGIGLRAPLVGNNDDVTVPSFAVEGYETGLWVADHFTAGRIAMLYVDVGIIIDQTHSISGTAHVVTIANWSIEQFNGGLRANGGGGSYCMVDIVMDAETVSGVDPTYDVSDTAGTLYGRVAWSDPLRTHLYPVVSGASNLKIINGRLGPGAWSGQPAVPASGTAQQNTAWRDATVYIGATGQFTIAVDGTVVGVARGGLSGVVPARVPSGHSITLAYPPSTFLSWQWVLD